MKQRKPSSEPEVTATERVFSHQLLDEVTELAWLVSADGKRITYMNRAAEAVYGLEKEKLQTRDSLWLGVMHPDDRPIVQELLKRLIDGDSDFEQFEFRVLKQNGTKSWLAARFRKLCIESAEPAICVLARDVTNRVRAEQQLDEAHAIYESLVQSIPVRVFRKNQQGRLVFCNQNFCDSIGMTLQELLGKTDFDLFAPSLAEKYTTDDHQVIESGIPLHKIEEHPSHDGGMSYVEVIKVPVTDARGRRIGIQGIFWDVTERIVSQRTLETARDVAEKASRAKSDFLASVSHEIRTPMNGIIGMTELLLDTVVERQHREYLSMIRQSAETLLNLINDLLDFSKIEAGKLDLDSAPFDLPESMGDTTRALALRAHEKRIELLMDFDLPTHLTVEVDGPRLQQVISNLVSNAIKFTSRGHVLVRIGRVNGEPDRFRFEVIDTGIGISPDKQKVIFGEFEQADKSTTRKYGGTGLGLAIASKIIEMMGSEIQLESQLGKGSRFFFEVSLPLVAAESLTTLEPNFGGPTVMLIEDHDASASILTQILNRWNVQVDRCHSFSEAHEKIEAATDVPVALLVDLSTEEDVSVLSWLTELRDRPDWERTFIAMLTSGQRLGPEFESLNCEKLLKPVKASDLAVALSSATGILTDHSDGQAKQRAKVSDRPLKILLAEDNQINQRLACAILEKFGHEVVVARDGEEVIEQFFRQRFDLVLMDVQMPNIDGMQATRMIRERERAGTRVPIIALSAHTYQGFREQCLESGMDDYLSKPLRRNLLMASIEKLTGRRSGTKSSAKVAKPREREIDWRQAFETVGGDRKLLTDLIQVFLDEQPQMLKDMHAALGDEDYKALQRSAHGMKGALNYLGAIRAVGVARRLEELAPTRNAENCREALRELEKLLKSLTLELQKFKTKSVESDG